MTDSTPTDGLALAELMSPELARNPQPMYGMLREGSPVLRVDGVGVVVTSRSGVDQILRDPGVFSSNMSAHDLKTKRPLIPLQIDPPAHRTYRKILDPLFAPQRMRLLEEPVARLVNDLIDGFVDDDEIDFAAQFSIPFPSQVFLTLFGLPLDDLPTFLDDEGRGDPSRPRRRARVRPSRDRGPPAAHGRLDLRLLRARARRTGGGGAATTCSATSCTPRSTATASPTRTSSTSASCS